MHEASKYGEFNVFIAEDFFDFLKACFPVVAIQIDVVEGDASLLGNLLTVVSGAYDGGDFDRHFTEFRSPEELVKAVIRLSHQDGCAHLIGNLSEVP